jgi:outer membrane biosynthesis protein TonB
MATRLNNPYLWAYTAAILLHILFLLMENPLWRAAIIAPQPEKIPTSPPLTFEFVDVPQNRDDAPPEETTLLAERDNISRDRQMDPLPESHLPYSDGISRAKNIATPAQGKSRSETQSADRVSETTDNSFSFVEVLQKNPEEAQKERERAVLGGELPQVHIDMDNRKTRALERGGLQLSTYDWNYAPYMKYLQRHIDRHIYPPRAFELGMIDGTTRVKFRIWRDGRLEGPELIDYKGHGLLRDTSLKAVELSADFKPLPPDFPDEYLEIVGTFEYIIFGKGQRR